MPLLGAIAGVPLLVPLLRACHCEKPLGEKIDQGVTPFSAALFSALIKHKNWLVLSGVYAGIIIFLIDYPQLSIFPYFFTPL